MQSVLLVPFPEVAEVVAPWLERSVGARPSHGIPPHITLLSPFPAPDGDVVAATREALAGVTAFDVRFGELRCFADAPVLYLAPEPERAFVEATQALVRRFPEWPPYGGAYPAIVPHLTVAWGEGLGEAEAAVAPHLPLRGRAREATLLTEVGPRTWEPRATFSFEAA
jgi:2'-5' RNA ligase